MTSHLINAFQTEARLDNTEGETGTLRKILGETGSHPKQKVTPETFESGDIWKITKEATKPKSGSKPD